MAGVPLVAPLSNYSAPVHIDVGGTNYTSCLETLTKFPHSKLAKLFNGTLPIAVDPVKQQYFLDRDGKVFRHILNYLRNGELTLPDYFTDTNLLLKEATFFQLEELCDALTAATAEPQGEEVETEQSDKESSSEDTETDRHRQLGRRGRTRRKNKKRQRAADECKETQGQSSAAAEHQQGSVLPANLYQEKMDCNELISVVTNQEGSVRRLLCSDQQFRVDPPDTWPHSIRPTYLIERPGLSNCYVTDIPNQCYDVPGRNCYSSIGFPWLAKQLYQKGYRLITSCVSDTAKYAYIYDGSSKTTGLIYHNFVK